MGPLAVLKLVGGGLRSVIQSWWFPYLLLSIAVYYAANYFEGQGYAACELDYAEAKEKAVAKALAEADELQALIDRAAANVTARTDALGTQQEETASEIRDEMARPSFDAARLMRLFNQATHNANSAAE